MDHDLKINISFCLNVVFLHCYPFEEYHWNRLRIFAFFPNRSNMLKLQHWCLHWLCWKLDCSPINWLFSLLYSLTGNSHQIYDSLVSVFFRCDLSVGFKRFFRFFFCLCWHFVVVWCVYKLVSANPLLTTTAPLESAMPMLNSMRTFSVTSITQT